MSAAHTDSELLELAAKAASIRLVSWNDGREPYSSGKGFVLESGRLWNPLTDDGDALRLAVACRLLVDADFCCAMPVERTGEDDGDWLCGMADVDRDAATRRAIVLAAAARAAKEGGADAR